MIAAVNIHDASSIGINETAGSVCNLQLPFGTKVEILGCFSENNIDMVRFSTNPHEVRALHDCYLMPRASFFKEPIAITLNTQ